jgi:hypothetical protein
MRSLVQLLFTTPRCTELCECTICNRFNPAKAIYDVERSIFELMCTWAAELFGSLHILELSGEWRLLKNYLAILISRNFCVTSPVNSLSVAFHVAPLLIWQRNKTAQPSLCGFFCVIDLLRRSSLFLTSLNVLHSSLRDANQNGTAKIVISELVKWAGGRAGGSRPTERVRDTKSSDLIVHDSQAIKHNANKTSILRFTLVAL